MTLLTLMLFHLQLHIVHMKHHYTDLGTALSDPEGVAVLGFFYKVIIDSATWLKWKYQKFQRTKRKSTCICIFSSLSLEVCWRKPEV